MKGVIFNNETLKLMSLFEKITKAKLRDCFEDKHSLLVFVVEQGELRKALGKNVANVKKLEALLNRRIRVIEHYNDITNFIKSLIFPMKVKDIDVGNYENDPENAIITIVAENTKTRGLIIGRNATNLRNYEFIVKKYFPLKEIKVI